MLSHGDHIDDKLKKAVAAELEWVRSNPKARQVHSFEYSRRVGLMNQ